MWRNKGLGGWGDFAEKVKPAMQTIGDVLRRATAKGG